MKITKQEVEKVYARALGVHILKTYLGKVEPKLLQNFLKNYKSCSYLSNLIKKLSEHNDTKEKTRALNTLCRFYCEIH